MALVDSETGATRAISFLPKQPKRTPRRISRFVFPQPQRLRKVVQALAGRGVCLCDHYIYIYIYTRVCFMNVFSYIQTYVLSCIHSCIHAYIHSIHNIT